MDDTADSNTPEERQTTTPSAASLSANLYPQPETTAGRGQSYSRTPIELAPLPIEEAVVPTPWLSLLSIAGLAGLAIATVDWGVGVWAGSDKGSLELAIVGPFALMTGIALLSWVFYRAAAKLLQRSKLPYATAILWSSILFILPVSQGLRWLIMPEILARTPPNTGRAIVYLIIIPLIWMGAVALITHLFVRSAENTRRRQIAVWLVIAPYLVTIPLGVAALVKALQLFP